MKRKLVAAVIVFFGIHTLHAQDSASICEPLYKTFHHLQKRNINIHLGLEYNGFGYSRQVYNAFNIPLVINYIPFAYTELGFRIKPSLLPYQSPGNEFTLHRSIFLRKHLLFSPCARYSVFVEGMLNNTSSKISFKGTEVRKGQLYPSVGFGMYKMINPRLQFTFGADLYFGRQPNQVSLSLLWNVKNFKLSNWTSAKPFDYRETIRE